MGGLSGRMEKVSTPTASSLEEATEEVIPPHPVKTAGHIPADFTCPQTSTCP